MLRRLLTLVLALLLLLAGCQGFEDPTFDAEPTRPRPTRTVAEAPEETEETEAPEETEETEVPEETEETEAPEEAEETEETEVPEETEAPEETEETEVPEETEGPALAGELPEGTILYLNDDGETIMAITPDGSEEENAYTIPNITDDDVVTGLHIDRDGMYLVYSVRDADGDVAYYLAKDPEEEPVRLPWLGSAPVWSPDGERFAALGLNEAGEYDSTVIYDVENDQLERLDFLGMPDWFPEGDALVYVASEEGGASDVFLYHLPTKQTRQATNFVEQGEEWYIDEAHIMPHPDTGEPEHVIFFGGPAEDLGASGNGMQWWSVPLEGGEDPEPYSDPSGSGVVAFAPSHDGTWLAYADHVSGLGCRTGQNLIVSAAGVGGGIAMAAPSPEFSADEEDEPRVVEISGLSWGSDQHLVYGVKTTPCSDEGEEPESAASEQSIYVWDVSSGNGVDDPLLIRIASGSFPVWID